jgi:hypothetical protein
MSQNTIISNQLSLKPSSVARTLGIITFFLVLASVGGQLITYHLGYEYVTSLNYVHHLISFFNVDLTNNFPAYFSSALLLFASLILWVITLLERKRKASIVSKWAALSIGFFVMAMDEAFAFHEKLIVPIRQLFFTDDNFGIFYFAWVIPGIAIVLFFAVYFLRFFFHLDAKTKLTFFIAATMYLGGAVGFELIDGYYAQLHDRENLIYSLLSNLEESLEMSGTIVFIWGLLVYISDNFKSVQFQLTSVIEQSPSDTKDIHQIE